MEEVVALISLKIPLKYFYDIIAIIISGSVVKWRKEPDIPSWTWETFRRGLERRQAKRPEKTVAHNRPPWACWNAGSTFTITLGENTVESQPCNTHSISQTKTNWQWGCRKCCSCDGSNINSIWNLRLFNMKLFVHLLHSFCCYHDSLYLAKRLDIYFTTRSKVLAYSVKFCFLWIIYWFSAGIKYSGDNYPRQGGHASQSGCWWRNGKSRNE